MTSSDKEKNGKSFNTDCIENGSDVVSVSSFVDKNVIMIVIFTVVILLLMIMIIL